MDISKSDKICLMCKEKIIQGRSDKKFCCDHCRVQYNNSHQRKEEQNIKHINSILRKNRSILKKLNPVGKTTVRKELLTENDFDFRFYTHTYNTESDMKYYFCYEFGYTAVPNEKVLIVNWQSYMKAIQTIP